MNNDSCSCRIVHQDKVDLARSQGLGLDKIKAISNLFKACADPSRLRILHALLHQEMCVCDLAALLDVSESAVSHQLRLLRTMGLVVNRRDGVVLYYRPVDQRISQLIALAGEFLANK
ncbi:MAG: metalloregulator ArsR/SmtB family transcription factor [Proteobacteria bacterium]|nr:metalloregulator ArsR/SmtB family transcription factor [Pseudomonadota bacterium]